MRHALFLALLLLSGLEAHARSLEATGNVLLRATARSLDFTSDTTTSSVRDLKQVMAARDDAASFIASRGEIRTAQLQAALDTLREQLPEAREASDEALALAILAR
jgi:uncharacterized protein (TIGR02448 family)